jgi:hypothetical protein
MRKQEFDAVDKTKMPLSQMIVRAMYIFALGAIQGFSIAIALVLFVRYMT